MGLEKEASRGEIPSGPPTSQWGGKTVHQVLEDGHTKMGWPKNTSGSNVLVKGTTHGALCQRKEAHSSHSGLASATDVWPATMSNWRLKPCQEVKR